MAKLITWIVGVALAISGAAGVAIGLFMVVVDADEEHKLIGAGIVVVSAAILAALVAVQRSLSHR